MRSTFKRWRGASVAALVLHECHTDMAELGMASFVVKASVLRCKLS